MTFVGISKVFSTVNDEQYNTIGAFWDEMCLTYGLEDLRGLGYNWTPDSIEYVIGLKEGTIEGANCVEELPDECWTSVRGRDRRAGRDI